MSRWSAEAYARALDFAAKAHGDQKVPGSGFPYVVHLTKVTAETLWACTADASLDADLALTCALLHDSVEDAGVTPETIEAQFGNRVRDGVLALTKNDTLPKAERMPDVLRRIREQPKEVWVVKLADRITNLEPAPPSWSAEKRHAYWVEAKTILEALGSASVALSARFEERLTRYLSDGR